MTATRQGSLCGSEPAVDAALDGNCQPKVLYPWRTISCNDRRVFLRKTNYDVRGLCQSILLTKADARATVEWEIFLDESKLASLFVA